MRYVDFSFLTFFWGLWQKIWGVVGPMGNFVQWLYNVNDRFHLAVKRVQFWITNATAHWSASFTFEPQDDSADLSAILQTVTEKLSTQPGFQLVRDLRETKTVRAGGVLYDVSCVSGVLHVQVADQTVSFRDSRKIIESHLMPVVELIENLMTSERRQYALTAHFSPHENPYLSVYLRRMDKDLINTFQCTYNDGEGLNRITVSINLDSVNVVTRSRERFRTESLKLLVLSRP